MTTPNIEELRLLAQTLEFSDAVRCSIQRAADLLQSQAERIKKLEFESSTHLRMRNLHYGENGKLRAQLEAIAAAEPVAWRWVWKSKPWDIEGWCYTNTPPNHPELQEIEKLFTRPMPAQDVTELVEALELAVKLNSFREFNDHIPAMRDALSKYKGAK